MGERRREVRDGGRRGGRQDAVSGDGSIEVARWGPLERE